MFLTLFTISALALSLSLLLASTPLLLGAWILLLTFSIASIFYIPLSSWLAIFTLLIYIGGLLVIFAYFIALAPNQIFEVKNIVISSFFITFFFSFIFFFIKPSFPFFFSSLSPQLPINSLLSFSNIAIFISLALILFLTLIAVVKISSFTSGPLRPWKFL